MFFPIPPPFMALTEEEFGKNIVAFMTKFTQKRLQKMGNMDTKWRVGPGAKNTGQVAIAVLNFDDTTGETLVFGAVEGDVVPLHQDVDGHTIITLAGKAHDITDDGESVELNRGKVIVHGLGSIHSTGTETFWVFLYYQPRGEKLLL
jgi:quercetin dioxygenase-like cupin family protein